MFLFIFAATWYRAVVLSEEEDNYVINFVDFGNIETVKSKDIRKFPAHLKDIPILGIGCSCVGTYFANMNIT